MVTAGPRSAVLSPVISISMPVSDKNLEAQSPLIFIFFFHLELFFFLRFHLLLFSIQICLSVSSLCLIYSAGFSKAGEVNRGNTLAGAQLSSLQFSLAALATGPLKPASWQIGCHPILMIIKLNQACSNNRIIHLSLSPQLNNIAVIIWAAGAANIPTVHQHWAPVALRPHWGGEGGRRRWTWTGGRGDWILGEEAGPGWTGRGSWTWQPAWEHGPCVEASQRLAVREREARREHRSHARHTGAQHERWQGSWSRTHSLDWCRWWCWGRWDSGSSGCRWGRGGGDCAGSAKAKQVRIHVTGVPQLSVGGLEIRRTCPHEKRVPQWPT